MTTKKDNESKEPAPAPAKTAVKPLTIRINPRLQSRLNSFSKKTGFTMGQIVETALTKYFKDME